MIASHAGVHSHGYQEEMQLVLLSSRQACLEVVRNVALSSDHLAPSSPNYPIRLPSFCVTL